MTQQRPMSLEQIQDFLDASQEFRFEGRGREEVYEWMKKTLVGQQYHIQGKAEKGLLRSYLGKRRFRLFSGFLGPGRGRRSGSRLRE
jgi:hypothetical protein